MGRVVIILFLQTPSHYLACALVVNNVIVTMMMTDMISLHDIHAYPSIHSSIQGEGVQGEVLADPS